MAGPQSLGFVFSPSSILVCSWSESGITIVFPLVHCISSMTISIRMCCPHSLPPKGLSSNFPMVLIDLLLGHLIVCHLLDCVIGRLIILQDSLTVVVVWLPGSVSFLLPEGWCDLPLLRVVSPCRESLLSPTL